MRLRNMLKICLVFWKSEPQYAYKLYAYKKKNMYGLKSFHKGHPKHKLNYSWPEILRSWSFPYISCDPHRGLFQ